MLLFIQARGGGVNSLPRSSSSSSSAIILLFIAQTGRRCVLPPQLFRLAAHARGEIIIRVGRRDGQGERKLNITQSKKKKSKHTPDDDFYSKRHFREKIRRVYITLYPFGNFCLVP